MYHLRRIKVLLATCLLACSSLWAQDVKISLENATAEATSDQGGDEGASSAIDGDYSKFWHSQWSWGAVFEKVNSVDLTIALSEVTLVDYVRYIPRQGSNQGHWGEVEVFYSPNTTGSNFRSIGKFDLKKADIPHDFFLNGTEGVSCGQIKFTIRSGSNNHATAAEIEMYQLDKDKLNAFAQCFSDAVYTELKPGVTSSSIADADVRALVQSMQSNSTSYKKFRVGEYEAYETLGTLQQRLKTKNQYSRYENPTGVYFTAGQSYLVAVSGIEDDAVGLRVKNWYQSESSSTYSLRNGLNYIKATTEGNVFVNYYTDNYAEAPKVKIHFINAPVIGYWDQETMTNSDWVALLADKTPDDHRIIITQSEHAQTAFPISAWKTHCHTDVETLMGHYQNVQWAIRDMMGLEKYGYQTRNRQIFYVVDGGFMAAGDEGAYCDYADLGGIMNANSFDFWGVGHEWGHNNQIHPGFHWSGCGETTNNIYASWAQYHFTASRDAARNPYNLRLEDEVSGIDEYSDMRGGRMQTYFEEAVRKGVAWQLQDGPDYHNATPNTIIVTGRDAAGNDIGEVTTTSRNYDHFVKLTPFWQLNLWGNLAGKCPDIITDVIHSIRTAENYAETYNTNGKQQINWMKLACDHAEIDLLPFFEKAGMLRPIHAYIEDYGAGWNIIDEQMIANLKAYVKQKGYPAYTEEINYINAHNMHIYRDNLKLNVTTMQGERNGDKVIVQHSIAQNAVAFETYNAQDELIRITMYGLGSDDEHSFTQVLFPSDAAYIMAVGYDGMRQIVYSELFDESELQALIVQTKALVNVMADVNYGSDIDMKSCNITSNYAASGYGTENLVDGNPATFFHSTYGGNTSAKHNLVIDLKDQRVSEFMINYTTLPKTFNTGISNNTDAPTNILVEGSNDGSSYSTIATLSSGLPTGVGAEYISDVLGDASTSYRYIRLTVNSSNGGMAGPHKYYFGLAELSLTHPITVSAIGDKYAEYISAEQIKFVCEQILIAQQKCTAGTATSEDVEALQSQYNLLLDVYNRADNEVFNALKEELRTLIASTNSLINSCGEEAPIVGVLPLQAVDNSRRFCVSSNADQNTGGGGNDGGGIAALVDNSENTYFHTRWGGTEVNEPHYIQVDMGKGVTIQKFVFSYKPRSGSPAPTAMKVYGSNDATLFTDELATITSGLPAHGSGSTYTSDLISSDTPYRYLRFVVTGSQGPGNNQYGGQYFFGMLEFDLDAKDSYAIEVSPNAGDVTLDLLLATYNAMQKAQNVINNVAITENQLQTAINSLQAQYDALSDAYLKNYIVQVNDGGPAEGGVRYIVDGKDYVNGAILKAPSTLSASELNAITVKGYDINVSIEIVDNVILVTYEKLYTVCIQGGEGKGGLCYYDMAYKDGDQFMPDFADEEMTLYAIPVTGYTSDVDVDHEGYTITVTYSLDRTGWGELVHAAEELIASCYVDGELKYINSAYADDIVDAKNAIATAKEQGDNAATLSEYDAAKEALNAAMSSLTTAKQNAEAEAKQREEAREALRDLIADAEALITECGTYGNGEHMVKTPVALQVNYEDEEYYLSTNADHNVVGGGSTDGRGIAALIDGSVEGDSYMHTQWGGNPVEDDHYVQVSLGQAMGLAEFTFTYATRKVSSADYNSPAPTIIELYGSNDGKTFTDQIARFTSSDETNPLISYKELGEYWESANIKPNRAYDYLRFYVRESKGPQSNTQHGDHYYFAMSEFALSAVSYETSYYVESLTSYGNVTEEQFLNVARAYDAANDLVDNSYDKDELVNAKNNLQAYYDVLMAAHNDYSYLPVTLTTDVENPALYTFNSKRGTTEKPKVLQYAPAEGHMFTIVDATAEVSAKQLFYFTKGTEKGQVYVHPFAAGEQVLAADNTGNGAAKVFARKKGAENYEQWTFEQETVDNAVWYSLKVVGAAAYFSNYGGEGRKMGFFGSKDNGSCMTFTPASIEGSAAYHTLKVYLDEAVKDVSSNNPGYYRGTDAHASVYETAVEVLGDQSSDDADYLNAYNTLLSVNESLEMILPEVGKFYVIRSAHDGYAKDALVYANLDDNKMRWGSKELTDATAIWTIVPAGDGAYHICNLHTGTYINGVNETLNETAGKVTLESLSVNGQLGFHSDEMMHAQSGGAIVNYTTSANGASAWRIEEVGHTAKIGQYLHTSLYLDYPTIIPEGVKAYIAKNPSEEGTIDLVKLQGNVLPANTGVILYSETPGTYYFLYTDAEATDDVSENLLKGSASEQYVGDETGAKKYYIFGRKDDNVGLYWARMDYTTDGSYVGNDQGTHFKASANKVYLELDVVSDFALSGFRFRIGDDETGIEGISTNGDSIIYDLYGRRIMEVVTPGIYIINGEKRYINIK